MAIALSCSNLIPTPTKKLPQSSLCPPASLSFSHKSFNPRPPKLSNFHSRFDGSAGEETEAIDESFFDDLVEEESDEDDETESSVDLLMRFLQSMFRKVSKRAKKASRSVLPAAISPQLKVQVSFAVDGVLLLAALSIVKALLEVVCTLGGTVFVVILLLRVTWAAVSYFQSSGNSFNQGEGSFGTTQPIT